MFVSKGFLDRLAKMDAKIDALLEAKHTDPVGVTKVGAALPPPDGGYYERVALPPRKDMHLGSRFYTHKEWVAAAHEVGPCIYRGTPYDRTVLWEWRRTCNNPADDLFLQWQRFDLKRSEFFGPIRLISRDTTPSAFDAKKSNKATPNEGTMLSSLALGYLMLLYSLGKDADASSGLDFTEQRAELVKLGMIDDDRRVTPKGRFYINAVKAVPEPVSTQRWSMPI